MALDGAGCWLPLVLVPLPGPASVFRSVFSGDEQVLLHFDQVYCECSFVELYSGQKLAAEVIDWLARKGFDIEGIYNPAYDRCGQAVQADFLFLRKGARGGGAA